MRNLLLYIEFIVKDDSVIKLFVYAVHTMYMQNSFKYFVNFFDSFYEMPQLDLLSFFPTILSVYFAVGFAGYLIYIGEIFPTIFFKLAFLNMLSRTKQFIKK